MSLFNHPTKNGGSASLLLNPNHHLYHSIGNFSEYILRLSYDSLRATTLRDGGDSRCGSAKSLPHPFAIATTSQYKHTHMELITEKRSFYGQDRKKSHSVTIPKLTFRRLATENRQKQ
jgi:hypothetical protein